MNSRIVKRFLLLTTCAALTLGSTTFAFADTAADSAVTEEDYATSNDETGADTSAEENTETTNEGGADSETTENTDETTNNNEENNENAASGETGSADDNEGSDAGSEETGADETDPAEGSDFAADTMTGEEVTLEVAAEAVLENYTIVFKSNGGDQDSTKITVTEGETLGKLPKVTRTGYKFLGWFTEKTGGEKITSSTVPTASAKYYAHWARKNYTVKFYSNGGKQSTKKISVLYGKKVGSLPEVTRRGYLFLGWYTARKGGQKISASTRIKANTHFYAHWKKITLKKAAVSVSSAGIKNFSADWNSIPTAEGYQIRYSMDKNMESGVTTVNTKKTAFTVTSAKNLSEGIYWIQVRSWRKDSAGKKTWSKWSTAKAIQYSYCSNNISVSTLNSILNKAANDEKRMALQYALARIGHPYSQAYRHSGYYYDCSSFAYYSYLSAGIDISGAANPAASLAYSLQAKSVSWSNLKVGDLVFWSNGSSRWRGIGHVAIYAGNGQIVDAGNEYYGCSLRNLYNVSRIIMCANPTA